ncbi:MAG: addiction module protein [Pyrinomonadaceae bacterium]
MADIATLEKEILSLDRQSRKTLISKLFLSLYENAGDDALTENEIEESWLREVERRSSEIDDDPSILIPGDLVMQEMRELLK